MKMLFRWVINAAALLLIAYLVPGFTVAGFGSAILAALILGLVNALIRPILVILTLPISILTLGLFLIVVNGLMLWLTATLLPGFTIDSFFVALLGAIILWAVGLVTNWLVKSE